MEVMHVHRVRYHVVAEVIRRAEDKPRFNTAAGHPDREAARMMVAAEVILSDFALRIGGPSKFPAPDHQRVVEQAAGFEVFNEGGAGFVGVLRLSLDALGQTAVMVPVAMAKLNETDPALGEAAGQETIVRVR